MNLELLPNELLLDLFNYLTGIRLLRAFYGLNSRFNLLLYKQFRAYRFDFSCSSKHQFDMICQQYLPFITDRISALTLSDCEDTPGEINLFLSYQPSFREFIHLQILSICYIPSYEILIKIVDELHYLSNLTYLKLKSCSFGNNQVDLQYIINIIWSLPKLMHYHFDFCSEQQKFFILPTKLSAFLQYVYISGIEFKWNQIYQLFEYTPRLKYLHILITLLDDDDYKLSPIFTLIDLKIKCFHMSDTLKMISFFKNVPNLRCLNVYLANNLIDGYQWEEVIRNYLPKLKLFELRMNDQIPADQNTEERVNELINSFRTLFWIDEHQWFIRCFTYDKTIHLQTLSDNIFYHCNRQLPDSWKSTYPDDDHQKLWNTVDRIHRYSLVGQPIASCICLQNIRFLSIILPIHGQFWSIVPTLEKLRYLIISSHNDTYQSELQDLFNHAPHLRYLHINQDESLPLQMSLFSYTNPSIRHLYLDEYNYWFNEKECITLTRSPLGVQCEMLSIQVKNRESIIILVENMVNLRVLHIECADDEHSKSLSLIENINEFHDTHVSKKNDLLQWLKNNLSSTYFISSNPDSVNCIRIWIQ